MIRRMVTSLSRFFQTGGHLLSSGPSEMTRCVLMNVLEELAVKDGENPSPVNWPVLERQLSVIPKGENVLSVLDGENYNLLQRAVGLNSMELVRWILNRSCDVNRGVCSLPLHIAALRGFEDIVELLLRHGARLDCESRMCYPGRHNQSCELCPAMQRQRGSIMTPAERYSERLQSAEYYAIDGDHAPILELLLAQGEDSWLPWQQKRPLLHLACERGAWNCVKFLVAERSEEINQCYDEYFPIHQASLQDKKFIELLIHCGADVTVKTTIQQLTVLHVVLLLGKKSAEQTLGLLKTLLDHGCRELVNEPDSLGNTPMHALIARYALEEGRYPEPKPWTKWDMLHLVRYLLQNGSAPSLNQPGNGALACMLRHVRDWEFRYELLEMFLQHGGDPNCVGRDGSVPLMVCLVPLINKDPLHRLTHSNKVCYLNSVRLLCKYGANPNCASRSSLTPLHVLVFTATEYITLNREKEKRAAFSFIRSLLTVMLQHGLHPNVVFSPRTQHILLALMDVVQNARVPGDLEYVSNLTLPLLVHGADPNTRICSDDQPMIVHSQGSMYLKKRSKQVLFYYVKLLLTKEELLALSEKSEFAHLIWLYYNTMEHRDLYQCLKQCRQLCVASTTPSAKKVLGVIRPLLTAPRTLKQIARVRIHRTLNHCVAPKVNKLALPAPLRDYLLLNWGP